MEDTSHPSPVALTEKYTIHTCFQLSVFAFQYAMHRFLVLRELLCILNIYYMAGNNSKKTTLEYITFLGIKKLTSSTACSRHAFLKSPENILTTHSLKLFLICAIRSVLSFMLWNFFAFKIQCDYAQNRLEKLQGFQQMHARSQRKPIPTCSLGSSSFVHSQNTFSQAWVSKFSFYL